MKHYALVSKTFVLFFLILVCSTYLFAQDLDDVTISGRVTDANKAIIPGATVTAILVESQQERTVTADDEGRYRLIELKPGT